MGKFSKRLKDEADEIVKKKKGDKTSARLFHCTTEEIDKNSKIFLENADLFNCFLSLKFVSQREIIRLKFWLKCIIDVSYGVALLFWTWGGGWPGWLVTGGHD